MGTIRCANRPDLRLFKGSWKRIGHLEWQGGWPAEETQSPGNLTSAKKVAKKKRRRSQSLFSTAAPNGAPRHPTGHVFLQKSPVGFFPALLGASPAPFCAVVLRWVPRWVPLVPTGLNKGVGLPSPCRDPAVTHLKAASTWSSSTLSHLATQFLLKLCLDCPQAGSKLVLSWVMNASLKQNHFSKNNWQQKPCTKKSRNMNPKAPLTIKGQAYWAILSKLSPCIGIRGRGHS